MVKRNYCLIVFFLFFLNIILVSVNAQETTRNVETDGDSDPEFIIHWDYDHFPDDTRADNVADLIEGAIKNAWQKIIIGWGFNEPIDTTIEIYINDGVNSWGDLSRSGTFWDIDGSKEYIYIDYELPQDLTFINIDCSTEKDCFDLIMAHEFFHAVQHNYGITGPLGERKGFWLIEGTARFLESVINPDVVFFENQNSNTRSLYIRDAVDYLKAPDKHLGIGRSSSEGYDVDIFWRYIFEHAGGISTIKSVFNDIKSDNPQGFIAEINSINKALSSTAKDEFINFAKANYLEFSNNRFTRDNEFYQFSDRYYENVAIVDNSIHEYSGKVLAMDPVIVEVFATSYVEFVSDQNVDDNVNVEFSGSPNTDWVTKVFLYDSNSIQIVNFVDGTVITNPDDYEKIAVMVANVGFNPGAYNLMLRKKPVIDIILDTDRSGSMSSSDMAAAKTAAKSFIDLLQEPIGGEAMDRVGLVSFDTYANLDLSLTHDFNHAKQIINGYYPRGMTNMGDALSKSINELRNNGRADAIRSILFFTDGYTNEGLSRTQILNNLIPQAVVLGIKIYTLGFGSADTNFLKEVASRTHGKYFHTPSQSEIKKIYEEISHVLKGWIQTQTYSGIVDQGETKSAGEMYVESGTGSVKAILTWPGSNLDLVLVDPEGIIIEPGMPGVFYSGDTLPEYYEILNPKSGTWEVKVYGKETVGSESFDISVYQPSPIIDIKPIKWDIDYSASNSQVFNVSELGGYSSITDVIFTASDLDIVDIAAEYDYMARLAEAELAGESLYFTEPAPESVIPGTSFSFTPNNFEVTAGSSEDVLAVLTVPPKTPSGNYSGSITVNSNAGNSTIIVTLDYVQPDVSPYELKMEALGKLRNMSSSSCDSWFWWFSKDCRNEHRINNAIDRLESSLGQEYWTGDFDIDADLGDEVFDYEKQSVEELVEVEP